MLQFVCMKVPIKQKYGSNKSVALVPSNIHLFAPTKETLPLSFGLPTSIQTMVIWNKMDGDPDPLESKWRLKFLSALLSSTEKGAHSTSCIHSMITCASSTAQIHKRLSKCEMCEVIKKMTIASVIAPGNRYRFAFEFSGFDMSETALFLLKNTCIPFTIRGCRKEEKHFSIFRPAIPSVITFFDYFVVTYFTALWTYQPPAKVHQVPIKVT